MFALVEQRLGQVERAEQRVVPAPAALREIVSVARDRDVEDREPAHGVGVGTGEREGGRAAPVVTDEEEAIDPQMLVYEPPDVGRDGLLVVAAGRPRGVAESAQVGRVHPVARREPRDHVPPLVRRLRNAVQQHDDVFGVADVAVVHQHVAEVGLASGR